MSPKNPGQSNPYSQTRTNRNSQKLRAVISALSVDWEASTQAYLDRNLKSMPAKDRDFIAELLQRERDRVLAEAKAPIALDFSGKRPRSPSGSEDDADDDDGTLNVNVNCGDKSGRFTGPMDGRKARVSCDCCDVYFTPGRFEAHGGMGDNKNWKKSLRTDDGRTIEAYAAARR